jgi:hypothetical protein
LVLVIPQEGILVAAQLVEKVVYVDMKALEERAGKMYYSGSHRSPPKK